MKVINNLVTNYNFESKVRYNSPNFKAISTVKLQQLKSFSNNENSRKIMIKLLALSGLTGILNLVNTLVKNKENLDKLNVIDKKWTEFANEAFLNSSTQSEYMDLIEKNSSVENVLWTKALLSTEHNKYEMKDFPEEEANLFLTPESNETFMSVKANKTIDTTFNYLNMLINAAEEKKSSFLRLIEVKLNTLIKEANKIQDNYETADLYLKITNIIKSFIFLNIINPEHKINSTVEQVIEVKENPINIPQNTIIEEEVNTNSEETKKQDRMNGQTSVIEEVEKTIEDQTIEEVDYSSTKEAKEFIKQPVILGKMDLPASKIKSFVYTPNNEDFIKNTFEQYFVDNEATIPPEAYVDVIDDIITIYNNFKNQKGRSLFLRKLSTENLSSLIKKYVDYSENNDCQIDFINFVQLNKLKLEKNKGQDITQDEFNLICSYKDKTLAYFNVGNNNGYPYIDLGYTKCANVQDRLKIMADFYKIAFENDDKNLITAQNMKIICEQDVLYELATSIVRAHENKKADDSKVILEYLKVDGKTLDKFLNENILGSSEENFKNRVFSVKDRLENMVNKTNLTKLIELLNNDKFSDIMGSVHARMRFITREILKDHSLHNKQIKTLETMLTSKIQDTIDLINQEKGIRIYQYRSKTSNLCKNSKSGVTFQLGRIKFGVNADGQIHSIYVRSES